MEVIEIRSLGTCRYLDESVEDGYVWLQRCCDRPDAQHLDVFMSAATFDALSGRDLFGEILDHLTPKGPGLHLLPASVLRAYEAEELRRHVEYHGEEAGEGHCVMSFSGCLQPATTVRDGVHYCAGHAELLQGWDDLAN